MHLRHKIHHGACYTKSSMKAGTFQANKSSIRYRRPHWLFGATVNTMLKSYKKNTKIHRFQGGFWSPPTLQQAYSSFFKKSVRHDILNCKKSVSFFLFYRYHYSLPINCDCIFSHLTGSSCLRSIIRCNRPTSLMPWLFLLNFWSHVVERGYKQNPRY